MDFLPPHISEYAEQHSSAHSALLDELTRYTQTNVLQPRMLSSKIQGRILSMISHLKKPDFILEIGTYTGYSALCLAEGLSDSGQLHTLDINDELREIQESFINRSGYANKITLHTGNALDILPTLQDITWDIVFIDADKDNYINYYERILPCIKKGGIILADNVLWSGKVTNPKDRETDPDTAALHAFNQLVTKDKRVESLLLPVRDGIMMIRVL